MSKKHKKHTKDHSQPQTELEHAHDEDLVVAPKGQSRFQFFFIWGLLIFVLLIFTIGGLFQTVVGGMFGGEGATQSAMQWTHPTTGEKTSIATMDWYQSKRALDRMWQARLYYPSAAKTEGERASVSDEDTGQWLLSDALAEEAGVRVTDIELGERVRTAFGNSESLVAWTRMHNTTPKQVQEDLRRILRAEKYRSLMTASVAVADPERVQELWDEQHPEYGFQYVQADVAGYETEATGLIPADEQLAEWFHGLPDYRQKTYHTEETIVADIAYLSLASEFDPSALFAKHPRPEDEDAEALAKDYYDKFSNIRFRVEPEEKEEGDEGQDPEPPTPERVITPYEEVQEICLREAPIHDALGVWLTELRHRIEEEGEELDFATEAAAIGLTFASTGPETTRKSLEEQPGWGGLYVAGQLAFGLEGRFLSRVILEPGAMVMGRLNAKLPGEEPPFDDIKADIGAEWAKEHAATLAVEKLEALRDSFGERTDDGTFLPTVDAETFTRVATEAGFEVIERPYLERFGLPNDDFDNASPGDMFVRVTAPLFELEEGQVPEAQKNPQSTHAFLVRYAGERTADMSALKPSELQSLRQQAVREAVTDFEAQYFTVTSDWVKRKYNLHLSSWDDEPASADM